MPALPSGASYLRTRFPNITSNVQNSFSLSSGVVMRFISVGSMVIRRWGANLFETVEVQASAACLNDFDPSRGS